MSRLARTISESGVYHILFRGVNQQNIFEEASDFEKLKEIIEIVKQDLQFEIYAYCFMSNHVHIVLKEKNCGDISLIMKRILTKYARWYNTKYGRSGALIANRYKSVPVEIDEYFLNLIRYIHQNPIKAGIVDKIENYPYSSFIEYINKANLADTNFLLEMISIEEFVEYHKELENMKFRVTDSKRKTDEDVLMFIKKNYSIDNPKNISKLPKLERNKILFELKKEFSVRHLQRITGVSRGVITYA
ncbi:transposase [Methanobrevibacter sp.]|uniref:transposase n=1 Tax=Methanobrevibacter sp. TaxID=66852 RepID=UPI003890EC72